MPREFVPKKVDATGTTDMHGNMGYSVLFSDGTPAFMLAKKAPEVGVPEYGEVVDTPKKSGEGTYKKFVRKQREEGGFTSNSGGFTPKPARNDDHIRAQWAISRALEALKFNEDALAKPEDAFAQYQNIKDVAIEFYKMVDEVKADKPEPVKEPVKETIVPPQTSLTDEVNLDDIEF